MVNVVFNNYPFIVSKVTCLKPGIIGEEIEIRGCVDYSRKSEVVEQKLNRDELVQSVLAHFDFDKVQKVMRTLNWKWVSSKTSTQIPTISEQVLLAKTYLEMAYDGLVNNKTDRYYCGSGGFKAIATRYEDGEIVLELDFVVAEFNWSSQDTCY